MNETIQQDNAAVRINTSILSLNLTNLSPHNPWNFSFDSALFTVFQKDKLQEELNFMQKPELSYISSEMPDFDRKLQCIQV
jgi:hypothetical protein